MVEYPQSFEENKISVVQKFVSEIDLLPKKFLKVETLYLSSNNIRTLEGLQQFSNLKNLSLANNEVTLLEYQIRILVYRLKMLDHYMCWKSFLLSKFSI